MKHKIVEKKISDLIEAEYNPRQLTEKQYDNLKDSIKRFGIVDPILINSNKDRKNIIIGGHQRVKVAEKLGILVVPCVELDLSYEKERELNIRLNKNTGEWNYDVLADLFDIGELSDWGFSENVLAGFKEIDYSILENEQLDSELNDLLDSSVKAIQIEFKLEDYELAYKMLDKLRTDKVYVGGLFIDAMKEKLK